MPTGLDGIDLMLASNNGVELSRARLTYMTAGCASQANFRFLVSDSVDLRRYAGDADLMLAWDDVLQVSGLMVRTAARMTFCIRGFY